MTERADPAPPHTFDDGSAPPCLLARFGFAVLDLTTRSWIGFWGTWAVWAVYIWWNLDSAHPFDPWPFVLLMGIVTLISYQQNVVIMTVQRKADRLQRRADEMQRKQVVYMMHLMEATRDALAMALARTPDPAASASVGTPQPKQEAPATQALNRSLATAPVKDENPSAPPGNPAASPQRTAP